ncbi:hypothetical protein ACVW0P_000533 [Mucilaginibacter sp. UYNi724]
MINNAYLINDARAWVKRKNGPDEVVRIILDLESRDAALCYLLYTAYHKEPDYLGRILFDIEGYWIYDGETLTINEQEQVAKFIINYVETVFI